MSVSSLYVLHGIVNNATFLSQISSSRTTPGIDVQIAMAAGYPQPLFAWNMGQRAAIQFDCEQLKTVLDLTGITIADLSANNTDLYFKKVSHMASRVADANASHIRLRMAQAGLRCDRITAGHRQQASGQCVVYAPYDGTNEPVVPAGSVVLAGTPSAAEQFVAGPISINGTQYAGVQDLTIDFGREMIELGGDGELYDTFAAERETKPVVTARITDNPWPVLGFNGLGITSFAVYLRAANRTARYADASEVHVKFSASAGYAIIDQTDAGGNDDGITTIRCTLEATSGAGTALTLDTTSAIT